MVMFNTCFIQINNNIPYIHVALSLVSKGISSRFSVETTKKTPQKMYFIIHRSYPLHPDAVVLREITVKRHICSMNCIIVFFFAVTMLYASIKWKEEIYISDVVKAFECNELSIRKP